VSEQLQTILNQARDKISQAQTNNDLLNLRSHLIGKNSEINILLKQLSTVSLAERPAYGKKINDIKHSIELMLEEASQRIKTIVYQRTLQTSWIDYTMPGRSLFQGSLHPLTQVQQQIEDVLMGMGFQVAENVDVEDDFHNFDALNTPKDHPARNLADTFYIDTGLLLRTHTSTVQIRVMENFPPPLKIISPGRCYRNDKFDGTHSPVFHQMEGLVIDELVSFKDLREMMHTFVQKIFGIDCQFRFRPHFFPFTEPSVEIDIACFKCFGKGCTICKNSGWVELAGAGMVDPNVFEAVGIDHEKYSGYAFGFGIDRLTMFKYQIPDIRMLFDNDYRFLNQFITI